jgi:uncharacterized SAM-binding protein YcdF (DUF218 family)
VTGAAQVLLVFGRGVTIDEAGRWALSPGSLARLRAAIDYVEAHGGHPRVIFTGGWAEASEAADQPPAGCREGDLMLGYAHSAGLDRIADLRAENRSRSTLENLVHTVQDGLLDGFTFTPEHPLGLVSHAWHLPRVHYLARKVLGLRRRSLLDVPVTDEPAHERLAHLAARLWFLGVRDAAALIRRERRMVALLRRLGR